METMEKARFGKKLTIAEILGNCDDIDISSEVK